MKGELKCERFTGGFHVVTRKNGQAVSYRWVFVQSQDRLAIKSTSTAAGAAPVVFADVVCARPSPR